MPSLAGRPCLCISDAPLLALPASERDKLKKASVRPKAVTHTNDISVQFRTAKEDGVIFATSNAVDDGYIKAYLEDGHVVVEVHVPGAGNVRFLLLDPTAKGRLFRPALS